MKRSRHIGPIRCLLGLALSLSIAAASAQESGEARPIPSLQELEAAGAIIGEIRVNTQNIFDLDDPREDNALYRAANYVHVKTRPGVIRRTLLFKSGEPLSVRLIEETERLLRANDYLNDVRIQPVAYRDGVVDIEVTTRDTWTLIPGYYYSRKGGASSSGISLREHNFLGTGVAVGAVQKQDAERSGREYSVVQEHALGGWTNISYFRTLFDDGNGHAFKLDRPFYALDTRWAAGIIAETGDRIDSIYSGSNVIGQYRHARDFGEVYGGWSKGLVNGWTHRYSIGLHYEDDTYKTDPSLITPPQVPADLTLVAPFLRYQVIEDEYARVKNRNLIEKVEYLAMGFQTNIQVGRAMNALGSTRDLWLYSATMSDGFTPAPGDSLLIDAYAKGRYGGAGGESQFYGATGRYYNEQRGSGLFFVSISADSVENGEASEQLLLGGENGLRGYPRNYQTGTRRGLLSVEQRGYTDWYPFRLLRVGGAVFYDYGRAWGGVNQNTVNPGWLSDIGVGLRILVDRSARSSVLHVDLAFPLKTDPNIDSFQFSITSKTTF